MSRRCGRCWSQGVDGGGDVAEAALEAAIPMKTAGVLTDLGDQRTLGELIGGDGGVVRRIGGTEGPGHLVVVVVVELEEVVDACFLAESPTWEVTHQYRPVEPVLEPLVPSGYT